MSISEPLYLRQVDKIDRFKKSSNVNSENSGTGLCPLWYADFSEFTLEGALVMDSHFVLSVIRRYFYTKHMVSVQVGIRAMF
jgi:hypothetical protein